MTETLTDITPIPIPLTGPVKIRIEGRPDDTALVAATLAALFNVTENLSSIRIDAETRTR